MIGSQDLEEGCCERGSGLFQGVGLTFLHKKKMIWNIYNLVTKEEGMGLRMKNISIMWVHWKITLLGGFIKNQYLGGIGLKGGLAKNISLVELGQ